MRADLLHVSRSLRRSPASAGAAILTLTLALGAAASIFAVVHTVLLTPPPFANPDSLITLERRRSTDPARCGQCDMARSTLGASTQGRWRCSKGKTETISRSPRWEPPNASAPMT
jgi:hypothetical protein